MDIGTIIEEGDDMDIPEVRPVEEPTPIREPAPEKAD